MTQQLVLIGSKQKGMLIYDRTPANDDDDDGGDGDVVNDDDDNGDGDGDDDDNDGNDDGASGYESEHLMRVQFRM